MQSDEANGAVAEKAGFSGSEQAALLLLMLGEEKAADVLSHISAREVERIGAAMANIRGVDSTRAEAVFASFQQELAAQTSLGVGVPGYVRKLLVSTMGDQRGATLADRLLGDEEPVEIDSLRWMECDALVQMLEDEHPQIIAVTLAHLDQTQAAKVIERLPPDVQDDVIYRIATMDRIPQSAMQQLQSALKNKLSISSSFKSKEIDGARTAANIINYMDTDAEARVMEVLGKEDAKLKDRVQDLMFVFGNLVDVDDKGMQLLLREVSSDMLTVALKGAEPAVRSKIFNNMSKRAREMLEEDMDAKGPVKVSEVEEAQKQILEVARRLAEEGQISLGKGGDDYVE